MKNKRLYKYYAEIIIDMVMALFLGMIMLVVCKAVLDYLYINYNIELVFIAWDLWWRLRGKSDFIYVIIIFVAFVISYILITYKKNNRLIDIIEETEEIANGNLKNKVKINDSGQVGKLAKNINSIVTQFENLTIEEKKAQQTKNDLITNVSHDLRTPLTSIIGYLEFINNDKYKDEVQLRYYVDIAYEKSKSLSLLINDLFELTKMQNNTMQLNKININLVELLGQLVAHFEHQFNEANMESRIDFSEDKLIVNGDPMKLARVFENLLTNAMKYGEEGYYVDIVTKLENNMAVVKIINYGQQIPVIDLPHIFDRFYRVEKSRNSEVGGSGLGLAITKNIVEIHEGIIRAESSSEKTIFEVKLPLSKD